MFCPNCGMNIPDDAQFCPNCGSILDAASSVSEPPEMSGMIAEEDTDIAMMPEEKKKFHFPKKKAAAILVLCIAAVVALGFGTVTIMARNLSENMQNYIGEFESLKDTYYLGGYEKDYKKTIQEARNSIESKSFRDMKGAKSSMDALQEDIVSMNEKEYQAFEDTYKKFTDLNKDYALGNYEEDYKKLLDQGTECEEGKKYTVAPKLAEDMAAMESDIAKMNEAVGTYAKNYDSYEDEFSKLYLSDEEQKNYETWMKSMKTALDQVDADACEEEDKKLEDLVKTVTDENVSGIENMKSKVQAFDTAELFEAEKEIYDDALASAEANYKKKNYKEAYESYQTCSTFVDTAEQGNSYDMFLEQVDLTDFPNARLYFSVENSMGEAVTDLNAKGFVLYELIEGAKKYKKVKVLRSNLMDQAENLNIAICADVSASMEDYGILAAEQAMNVLVDCLQVNIGDKAALYSFSDSVAREASFTSSQDTLKAAIGALSMGDMTSLYDALAYSLSEIIVQNGAKCVIAFTDGMENNSVSSKDYVIQKAQQYNIPIYLIGIGSNVDSGELSSIAAQTGGFFRQIASASDMADIYQEIYRQQKSMYVVEYVTEEEENYSAVRHLYVTYTNAGVVIRMQDEYLPENYKIAGYIFHDSDSRYLTEEDLNSLTEAEVRIALNEIYARRGYIFNKSIDLKEHFDACSWYNGTSDDMDAVYATFNEYEKANVDFLVSYEVVHKLNGRVS